MTHLVPTAPRWGSAGRHSRHSNEGQKSLGRWPASTGTAPVGCRLAGGVPSVLRGAGQDLASRASSASPCSLTVFLGFPAPPRVNRALLRGDLRSFENRSKDAISLQFNSGRHCARNIPRPSLRTSQWTIFAGSVGPVDHVCTVSRRRTRVQKIDSRRDAGAAPGCTLGRGSIAGQRDMQLIWIA